MGLQSLDVVRRSAATSSPPRVREALEVAKLIDVSKCIGCKACQVACMEWNDVRDDVGTTVGVYDNPPDLSDRSWTVMRFYEEEIPGRGLQWLIVKDGCMHFQEEHCIGCGYCQTACPFDIPRYSAKDQKAYKCTLCSDRVAVGLEPACIKTCPTQALSFGSKAEMKALAEERVAELVERGFKSAAIYDPPGVQGTHVVYVLPHGDPALYRLPRDPEVSPLVELWRSRFARSLGVVTMAGVVLAGIFHYMKVGPIEEPKDEEAKGG